MCGDPWNAAEPRDHELGGRYASGAVIVRRYRSGDAVPVVVELTAAHRGYFEFRICPVEDHPPGNSTSSPSAVPLRDPSPECLDRNVLQLVGGGPRYTVGPRTTRMHQVDVRLPPGLECKHCLFQWKYHTGKHDAETIEILALLKHVNLANNNSRGPLVKATDFHPTNLASISLSPA